MSSGLGEYAQTASDASREEIILDHLWLVRHIVGRLTLRLPSSVDNENLESAGVLGLVESAERFDATRGVDFKAFASIRIRGAILDELRRNCPLPQAKLQQVTRVNEAQQALDPPVTAEKIAGKTGMTVDEVLDCLASIPITQPKSLEGMGDTWLPDSMPSPDMVSEKVDTLRLLTIAIESLPERERTVVTLYYKEGLRLKEIGAVLNLSESRISRLLTSTELQLREFIRARQG